MSQYSQLGRTLHRVCLPFRARYSTECCDFKVKKSLFFFLLGPAAAEVGAKGGVMKKELAWVGLGARVSGSFGDSGFGLAQGRTNLPKEAWNHSRHGTETSTHIVRRLRAQSLGLRFACGSSTPPPQP